MKPKLTVEREGSTLVFRHKGAEWRFHRNETQRDAFHIDVRKPGRFSHWTRESCSTVEAERKIIDLISERLHASDFWNGQSRLF